MRGGRTLLTALALLGALLPGRVAGAGLDRTLTITGSRNAYAILTVTEETTYWLDHTVTADYTGSRWAGFAIGTDWPKLWTVYTHHTAFGGLPSRRSPTHAGSNVGVLYPGRYRVYLFADGRPVTITMRWTGRNTTLEPDAPLDAHIAADQQVVVAGSGRLALPQDGAPGTVTAWMARFQKEQPTITGELRACFAQAPASWATCDRRFGRSIFTDSGSNLGGGYTLGGIPRPLVTRGRSFFAERTGTATGILTAVTLRYRPHPDDSRPADPY